MHCITEEQREYLMTLPLRNRQKEILKEEYLNGEWYERDIRAIGDMPKADCWTFGAPCQDFSFAGKRAGLDGDRSALVREVFTLLEKRREEDRPEWLIYENVKGMLSTNGGFDYLEIITEMDRLGYDCEWQNINSAWYVPQNRERIYTIGHLRSRGRREILPITRENSATLKKIIGGCQGERVYDPKGISCTLTGGGGGGGKTGLYYVGNVNPSGRGMNGNVYSSKGLAPTVTAIGEESKILVVKCIGGLQKHQQFRQDGNAPTLTGAMGSGGGQTPICAIWSEKYQCYLAIRRLTPRECFRLQGWTDDYFDKAQAFNSDSQLYKQAGNGITVNVAEEIGKKIKEIERSNL
jgi:DNA (cytosine-5)-methyltransferase 1